LNRLQAAKRVVVRRREEGGEVQLTGSREEGEVRTGCKQVGRRRG
jgi:hypothetical protein